MQIRRQAVKRKVTIVDICRNKQKRKLFRAFLPDLFRKTSILLEKLGIKSKHHTKLKKRIISTRPTGDQIPTISGYDDVCPAES